jgi:hypothetical protein
MLEEAEIKRAAEEAMRALKLEGWRVEVEPALGSPHAAARQLRLYDPSGKDDAVVVEFRDADRREEADAGDLRERVTRQPRAFAESL